MSVVRADSVGPSAGGTTRALVRGTAAAWVNFNGTGTIAARDSENVSSLTDNGTGNYTINFTNAMANGNYGVTYAGGDPANSAFIPLVYLTVASSGDQDVSIYTVSSVSLDPPLVCFAFNGDLA